MSKLLIHIPAQVTAQTPQALLSRRCAYTLLSKHDVIERVGNATLGELATTIATAKQVILLLAGVDVTLLRMQVPPLSAAKLRSALPNLIEDRLLEDVSTCVVSCTANKGTMQTVAVTRRVWLELLLKTALGLGAQRVSALPSQLSLPLLESQVSATLQDTGSAMSLILRLSEHEVMGIVIDPAAGLLNTLRTLVPEAPITLFLASDMHAQFQTELATDSGITIKALNDTHLLLPDPALNLVAGIASASHRNWNWRPWRWPLLLAGALIVLQTLALNLDWWHLSREAHDLRSSMNQLYLASYPNESVILDPLIQMQQKIAVLRHDVGLSSADDFNSLTAEFGVVWASSASTPSISALEYHDRSLKILLKSAYASNAIRAALAQRGLTLEVAPDSELTWIIRSQK